MELCSFDFDYLMCDTVFGTCLLMVFCVDWKCCGKCYTIVEAFIDSIKYTDCQNVICPLYKLICGL